jgi:hypothetical protein
MKTCKHATCDGPCRRPVKPKPKRKPIKRVSKKRGREERKYSVLRKQFLETNPECQAKLKMCRGEATDIHHVRGRVGEDFLNTDSWLSVCRPCHLWIESHPVAARELGLSESRLIIEK